MAIRIRRVYEPASPQDGYRILVDRLWPRGISKAELVIEEWPKVLAPSNELRKWYGHVPERFPEFRQRYLAELDTEAARVELERLRGIEGTLTLLTATRETEGSHATVLAELLG